MPIQLEKVVLEKFLSELAATLSIEDLQIEVDPVDLTVLSDPDHLNRIFLNLLENAVKYAPGAPVEVRARASGNRVEVAVSDHGAGIPADQRDRIFHRFTQVEGSATRTRGGTGLGLSIVKGLAEAMKGDGRVDRDPRRWGDLRRQPAPDRTQPGAGPPPLLGRADRRPAAEMA